MKKRRRRFRRRMLVAFVAIVVICLGLAFYVFYPRDHYGFLRRFHPRQVEVDLGSMLPQDWLGGHRGRTKLTMLVFPYKQAPAVLAAMRKELTLSHGFVQRNMSPHSGASEAMWQFNRVMDRRDDPDGATFSSGTEATHTRKLYEGKGLIGIPTGDEQPSCIVIISPAQDQ